MPHLPQRPLPQVRKRLQRFKAGARHLIRAWQTFRTDARLRKIRKLMEAGRFLGLADKTSSILAIAIMDLKIVPREMRPTQQQIRIVKEAAKWARKRTKIEDQLRAFKWELERMHSRLSKTDRMVYHHRISDLENALKKIKVIEIHLKEDWRRASG